MPFPTNGTIRCAAVLVACAAAAGACARGETPQVSDTMAPAAARVDTVVLDSTRRDTMVPDTTVPDTTRPDTLDTLNLKRDTFAGARPKRP